MLRKNTAVCISTLNEENPQMKKFPRFVGLALIMALLNVGQISIGLASVRPSPKIVTARVVLPAAATNSQPIPQPTPTHASKAELKQDLDDTKSDLQTIIGTDPDGFAAQLLTNSGLDPIEDIDEAKNDLDGMSTTDFDNAQSHFDKLHKKFQKRHHNMAAIIKNPTLMAMLHRPSPLKFRVVAGNMGGILPGNEKVIFSTGIRSLSLSKSGNAPGAYTKDFANLRLVVMPELTATCSKGSGIPGGINDLILVKAITLATETVKEAIPDDTAQIVPHSIAVVAWAAAKTAEFVLDSLHATYLECNAVQQDAANDQALASIKSSVTSTSNSIATINTNVSTVKNTVDAINTSTTTINNGVVTVTGKVDTVNNTVNNINNSINTINNTVNTTSNNVNTANTNITALSDLSLRLMIEAALSSPDNSTPVGLFETPLIKGGYLELVRTIVVATIANLAGSSTSQANSALAQGDNYKAAGNYKAAYAAYKKAYKTASN